MMGSSSRSASGSGSGPPYLDPHRVYELLIRLSPREALDYLDSIPGSSRDANCNRIRAVANALRALLSQPLRLSLPEESRRIQRWAQRARSYAENSRFCAPEMVCNPSNFTPAAGHNPLNSSSCSGRMLTKEPGPCMHVHKSSSYSRRVLSHEPDSNELTVSAASSSRTPANPLPGKNYDVHRHAAMHNPLSASSSRIPTAMLCPLQANSKISFPTRHAGMRAETSASKSGTHASTYVPSCNSSMIGETEQGARPNPLPQTRQEEKGRMGSSLARRFSAPGGVSRRGGARQPTATTPPSLPSSKRGGGARRPAPTSPSSPPPTSPQHTSLTSPRRPCRRARRPLRLCQRRILNRPPAANTAPPRRSLRLAAAYAGGLGSWSVRQTVEKVRVYYSDDDCDKREETIRSWADDDSDDSDD